MPALSSEDDEEEEEAGRKKETCEQPLPLSLRGSEIGCCSKLRHDPDFRRDFRDFCVLAVLFVVIVDAYLREKALRGPQP